MGQNAGFELDHLLVSPPLAGHITAVGVDAGRGDGRRRVIMRLPGSSWQTPPAFSRIAAVRAELFLRTYRFRISNLDPARHCEAFGENVTVIAPVPDALLAAGHELWSKPGCHARSSVGEVHSRSS